MFVGFHDFIVNQTDGDDASRVIRGNDNGAAREAGGDVGRLRGIRQSGGDIIIDTDRTGRRTVQHEFNLRRAVLGDIQSLIINRQHGRGVVFVDSDSRCGGGDGDLRRRRCNRDGESLSRFKHFVIVKGDGDGGACLSRGNGERKIFGGGVVVVQDRGGAVRCRKCSGDINGGGSIKGDGNRRRAVILTDRDIGDGNAGGVVVVDGDGLRERASLFRGAGRRQTREVQNQRLGVLHKIIIGDCDRQRALFRALRNDNHPVGQSADNINVRDGRRLAAAESHRHTQSGVNRLDGRDGDGEGVALGKRQRRDGERDHRVVVQNFNGLRRRGR